MIRFRPARVLLRGAAFPVLICAAAAWLFSPLTNARAGIDDNFEWKNGKRVLYIKIADENATLGGVNIKTVMDAAISNWNNISPPTGWTLRYHLPGENEDIKVSVGTITDSSGAQSKSGGACVSGFTGKNVEGLKLEFDPKPKEGYRWGQTGSDKLDPVVVAKHELSHCMRLDHEGGVDTGNLADPVTPGNHNHTPSERDKKHVSKAAAIAQKAVVALVQPGLPAALTLLDWSHCENEIDEYPFLALVNMETRLLLGPDAVVQPGEIQMTLAAGANVPPPWPMPGLHERFVRGLWAVTPDSVQSGPGLMEVQIPYFDGVTDMDPCLPEELLDLANPQWGRIVDEMTLYPVIWNPVLEEWTDLRGVAQGFAVDPGQNLVHFALPVNLLTAFPDGDGHFVTCLGVGGPFEYPDCNGNGIDDGEELGQNYEFDCNENWTLDACDIASGYSLDLNLNGIPDECETTGVPERIGPRLLGAYPNPFNPRTTIRFELPDAGPVRLAIYDVLGGLIRTLVDKELPAGSHEAVWDGKDLSGRAISSGSYLARLEAGGKVEGVRLSLVR